MLGIYCSPWRSPYFVWDPYPLGLPKTLAVDISSQSFQKPLTKEYALNQIIFMGILICTYTNIDSNYGLGYIIHH